MNAREALEDMVWQFAYRGVKGRRLALGTGGLSALERAFDALGWDDPHYVVAKGQVCEVQGCLSWLTQGRIWGEVYVSLCSEHGMNAHSGQAAPRFRRWVIVREKQRDSITRILPQGAKW